ETDLETRTAALAAREAELRELDAVLAGRTSELEQRERALETEGARVQAEVEQTAHARESTSKEHDQLERLRADAVAEREQLGVSQLELAERDAKLTARATALALGEAALLAERERVGARDRQLGEHEQVLAHEASAAKREAERHEEERNEE